VHERHRASLRSCGRGAPLNRLQAFLEANHERLGLEQYGLAAPATYVLVTPRFRASRHVVFLVLPQGSPWPALVAKIPRLEGDIDGLAREHAGLAAADAAPELARTIPRVVAFDRNEPLLLETALRGRPLMGRDFRRSGERLVPPVVDWLVGLPRTTGDEGDFHRLLEEPLQRAGQRLGGPVVGLVARTLELVAPLRSSPLPLVLEHGDLSEPNVILLNDGSIGFVDWELSEPRGLPANDLFFYLVYVAFAWSGATALEQQLAAVREAFFSRDQRARQVAVEYARRFGMPSALLTPLFVATWARYTAGLLDRLADGRVRQETADWLTANRFYKLWELAVAWADELEWR
jgi:aminoglycoside phosphotransferase